MTFPLASRATEPDPTNPAGWAACSMNCSSFSSLVIGGMMSNGVLPSVFSVLAPLDHEDFSAGAIL
jgi:hypothetical protein